MITSSTMAAEFIACFETSNYRIWLKNFIIGLRIVDTIKLPLKLYYNYSSAVLCSNNNRSSSKSKHIDIKFLAVKEIIQSGLISIKHIGTTSMVADPLTKGLIPKQFHEHVAHMGIYVTENSQVEWEFVLIFHFYVLYDILFQISCSTFYMTFCDFVCIMQLFSYSVLYTL
jgi:hypothetical protein